MWISRYSCYICRVRPAVVQTFDPVTPIGFDQRTRELIIHNYHVGYIPIWRCLATRDSKVVVSGNVRVWCISVWIGALGRSVSPWIDVWKCLYSGFETYIIRKEQWVSGSVQ